MAKAKRKNTKTVDKWKKKKWFKVQAPKLFKEQDLGETIANDPDILTGRRIEVNMATLTGNMKAQNQKVTFEVTGVQGQVCNTNVRKFELIPSTIKRKVKKGKDRVDDSFTVKTKDAVSVRVKPMMITDGKTSNSIQTLIRKRFVFDCKKVIEEKTWDSIMLDVLTGKLMRDAKKNISKIYPLRALEMRSIERVEGEPQVGSEEYTYERPARRPRRNDKPYVKKEDSTETEDTPKVEEKPAEVKEAKPVKEEAKAE